jgi:multiple sugar transport system substrate-binding protein
MVLRGLTWKHDRGLAPLLATAREFAARRPDVSIEWEARSLHEFGDVSVASIANRYDMIVIDHPFMGEVARDRYLLAWDEMIPRETLETLASESVGPSHETYVYEGHQWALAIDAAAQVSGYRPDLFEAAGVSLPKTWRQVIELAKTQRRGFVTPALLPLDSLMCFFSICAAAGEPCFSQTGRVVGRENGELALNAIKTLANHAAPEALASNPIAIWERMSTTDDIAYCPLAFGYSNYSRPGYRRSLVSYTNVPAGGNGATLGGAGLAITASCRDVRAAAEYGAWIAGADCQRTLYVQSGGQPGNKRAWTDPDANAITNRYFRETLHTLEHAFVRPRYAGFVDFQTAAAQVVAEFLKGSGAAATALDAMDELYARSHVT